MIGVSTAAEMRELDRRVIEGLGLPGIALMELASAGVAQAIRRHHHEDLAGTVVVATGGGNNGGDGWAVARWLHGWGYAVRVWPVGPPKTDDAATMATVARAAGVVVSREGPEGADEALDGASLVVDAVLGTGLSSEVRGAAAAVLRAIVTWGGPVVAVDVPSGLHSDSGVALGPVPRARRTVTFARAKRGLYAADGPDLAGEVEVVDIGLGAGSAPDMLRSAARIEASDVPWPRRPPGAHKGTSGHLAVVAGSEAMAGAAVLCCLGALAAEAGKVTLVTAEGALPRLGALPAEVMLSLQAGDRLEGLPDLGWADAMVAGPGLGGGRPLPEGLAAALRRAWCEGSLPMVFDADALEVVASPASSAKSPRVITPHPGEAARLLGCTTAQVSADRFGSARRLGELSHGTALLKGRFTLVDDGHLVTINPTGGPALASGGTGDVLAGMVGAFLARGLAAPHAARTAAWWHGVAGEALGAGARASELPSALRRAISSGR